MEIERVIPSKIEKTEVEPANQNEIEKMEIERAIQSTIAKIGEQMVKAFRDWEKERAVEQENAMEKEKEKAAEKKKAIDSVVEEMEWAIKNNKMVEVSDSDSDSGPNLNMWRNWSIYKIPSVISNMNHQAYTPQLVSFGPYHHGKKRLKAMEVHKQRAVLNFLKRKTLNLKPVLRSLVEKAQELKDSYDSLDDSWRNDTKRFLQLMVVDGCFMLEILLVREWWQNYHNDDPIFSDHGKLYVVPIIKRDMLLVENQLPMFVLVTLLGARHQIDSEKEIVATLNHLILGLCNPLAQLLDLGKCLHVLDLFRKSLLHKTHQDLVAPRRHKSAIHVARGHRVPVRSATELHGAGIRFRRSRSLFLDDISFENGILRLPVLFMEDIKDTMLLNLIAFEQCHVGAGYGITFFIRFMDDIVQEERDVSLLRFAEVIQNVNESDKTTANLLKAISKDLKMPTLGKLDLVQQKMAEYCNLPWNKGRANLFRTYFRSPWINVSIVPAIILFGLTVIQTVYSILQFGQGRSSH